jgi:PAS domain S-box-containing protein
MSVGDNASHKLALSRANLPDILVGLSLVIISAIMALAIVQSREQRSTAAQMERHTYEVLLQVQKLSDVLQKAETGSRGYLLTNDRQFLDTFNQGSNAAPAELAQLRRFTRDNDAQQENIDQLALVVGQRLQRLREGIERAASGDQPGAIELLKPGQGFASMRSTQAMLDRISDIEKTLLKQRRETYADAARKADFLVIGLLLLIVLILGFAIRNLIAANRAKLKTQALETEQSLLGQLRAADAAAVRSAALVSAIGDSTPDCIYAKDRHGRIIYANPSTVRVIGQPLGQILGASTSDFNEVPEEVVQIDKNDARIMETGVGEVFEETLTDPAGQALLFRSTKSPLLGADGEVIGIAGISVDITAERQAAEAMSQKLEAQVAERTAELATALTALQSEVAERERVEAQIRQMQKIESIGQLTGGIAHDFNNMLAVVLGSLEIVRRRMGSDPAKALSAVENAEEGAKRAAQLTARLLAFSRQLPLAPEPVDANSLVGGMSELLRSTIGEPVQIETVLAGGLWKCLIDAPQLENAIVNLCVNARDAMPDGGKLTIETHNCHLDDNYAARNAEVEAGQYVLVSVSDSGSGMPPAVIERAFDPFFTTKEVGKGTGLGLSQVHGFVRQSGGHIKIYSEEGAGTTVKLYLPRYIGKEAVTSPHTSTDDTVLPLAKDGETVLVVEDEAQVRQVSVEQLRDLGYAVIEAASGEEALLILANDPRVDLIFTDIVMPGMNGRMLADSVAASGNHVQILYTTGYTRNAVVHNRTLDPGTEFIAKPYTARALATKVRAVLDRR